MIKRILTIAALLAAPAAAQEPVAALHQTPRPAYRAGDYAFQLFVPRGYHADDDDQRWPLMIFLHGSGERGRNPELVTRWGPPHVVADHPGTPMIIVSPQLRRETTWTVEKLDRLLADVRRAYRVDPARIYLTGLSLGGMGAWEWAIARPRTFAAVAPVAARFDTADACRLMDTPVWAFHGDEDDIIRPSGNWNMVEAIRACGGSVKPRLTIYPGMGHESWRRAYDDPALWRWFLEQRRLDFQG